MSAGVRVLLGATVILLEAGVQALLVITDPVPGPQPWFVLLAAASVLAAIAGLWALATITCGGRPRWRTLGWVVVTVVVSGVAAVLLPPLTLVTLTVGLISVASSASGRDSLHGFAEFARHPVRRSLGLLGTIAVLALAWIAALLLGLLVTGVAASFATWIVFGGSAAVLLRAWRVEKPGIPD